jgi:pilus assembly protein CpaB
MMGGGSRRGSPRRSGARALTFWLVALVAGGSAALLLRWYIERSTVPVQAPMTKIVVAAIDLPIATTLRPEHMKLADWPAAVQPVGGIRDPKELINRVITAKIVQGEPILASKVASKDAGRGLAALIPVGLRAEAVKVDEVVGVAGFIHPEDRVDVIATLSARGGYTSDTISKVILQNVKVLTVGKQIDVSDFTRNKALSATVVTLLVDPAESEQLALIANSAKLTLALRSWTDEKRVETPGADPVSLLTGAQALRRPPPTQVAQVTEPTNGKRSSKKARPEPTTAPSVVATPQKDIVEILRGDRFEERKFEKEKP